MKLQAPVLFAVVVPSLVPVVLHTVTVEFANAVPVRVKESLELTAILLMTGPPPAPPPPPPTVYARPAAAGAVCAGTVTPSGLAFTLVPAAVVSLAVKAYAPADMSGVVKLQAPVLFALVVP